MGEKIRIYNWSGGGVCGNMVIKVNAYGKRLQLLETVIF
jgi:hypothetical protein